MVKIWCRASWRRRCALKHRLYCLSWLKLMVGVWRASEGVRCGAGGRRCWLAAGGAGRHRGGVASARVHGRPSAPSATLTHLSCERALLANSHSNAGAYQDPIAEPCWLGFCNISLSFALWFVNTYWVIYNLVIHYHFALYLLTRCFSIKGTVRGP